MGYRKWTVAWNGSSVSFWYFADKLIRFKQGSRLASSQPVITYSKLTIAKLEQRCEIFSKLTIKTPKWRHWCRFGVFIVSFEHISHLCSSASIVNFEQVNTGWDNVKKYINLGSISIEKSFFIVAMKHPKKTGNKNIKNETFLWMKNLFKTTAWKYVNCIISANSYWNYIKDRHIYINVTLNDHVRLHSM